MAGQNIAPLQAHPGGVMTSTAAEPTALAAAWSA